ncbi:MAG: hypothetical protein R3195_01050 [Gemmatimonadota bacterium]|nr:hypothetical protein [Gemmatimonadota bacterium]
MTDDPRVAAADEDEGGGRIGIFPTWRAVYITVLIYTAALTVALYAMSRLLDHSSG